MAVPDQTGEFTGTDTVFCAEVELVRGCLAGEEVALRSFVERFQGMVFGLCLRMLGHRHDAEDVSQDVFARIFRNLHRWDQARPLKPWLMTIAANRCRTVIEQRSRLPLPVEVTADQSDAASQTSRELAEELQLALERLRDDYRTCFVMFYYQELSCAEIGELLDCPQGTVKTWLHRARRELAGHLKHRGLAPENQNALP
jgi:RNA polymerase sigma-70 factor (ECF subfamily)